MSPDHSYFSGDPLHFVASIAFAGIGAWNLWTACRYGYVSGRRVNGTRADQPVLFWILTSASALCCIGGLYFMACAVLRIPPPWYP